MESTKVESCQKYYIFTVWDIVNNSFHGLEEKRMECLTQYMDLCINTYDDYRTALDSDKLKKSYCGLIDGMRYQLAHHPFRKLEYRDDFAYIRELSENIYNLGETELLTINRCIITLKKKLESSDLIGNYLECLKHEEDFQEIDYLKEALVSDLLNKGYSLMFLSDWFKKQQEEFLASKQNLAVIEKLRDLNANPQKYTVYIKFEIKSVTQRESALELIKKQFEVLPSDILEKREIFGEGEYYIAKKGYMALDALRAISMAYNEFNAIKELYNMWQGMVFSVIKDDVKYYWIDGTEFEYKDVRKLDNVNIMYTDNYYKKQMERFLTLRDAATGEDLPALERILYTLNAAKTYKNQNRFLNFWSALEYELYSFPRLSIIEKARDVVPASFGLFYIKQKLNTFWERITHFLEKRMTNQEYLHSIELINACRDNEGGYDTKKLIGLIQDTNYIEKVASEYDSHVVLYRELAELNMLFSRPAIAKERICDYYEGVKHDLNYIYRLRNQLIHSTSGTDELLEYSSMRLYRYANSILSTILYYKEKNPAYTIVEILNSLDATYRKYIACIKEYGARKRPNGEESAQDSILSVEEAYRLARPSYLFME